MPLKNWGMGQLFKGGDYGKKLFEKLGVSSDARISY
jgi:hypothetical protein